MRSVPSLLSMLGDQLPPRHVMTPWLYVRLRRAAAGLSIAQAAKPFWVNPAHQYDCERNMAALEQEGIRAQYLYQSQQNRYFFSIAVYHQLANLPLHQHPRLCICCAWDAHTVQYDHNGHDVTWSADSPEICTRCEQAQAWKAQRAEGQGTRHAA